MSTLLHQKRADYGFDAPTTVVRLILLGIALLACGVIANTQIVPLLNQSVDPSNFISAGSCIGLSGLWMVFGSRVLKFRARDKLIRALNLQGNEFVLDVGCGRGLILIEIAKKLTSGKAVGIDLWRTVDQSGNGPDVTLRNAELEGVSDKIQIATGDARKLPFPNQHFDVVTSSWAIHNISGRVEREHALNEMLRVLKPGGQIALMDIKWFYEYKQFFSKQKGITFDRLGPDFTFLTPTYLFLVKKKDN